MAAPQKFLLRVYEDTDVAMKLSLNGRPKSVEELKMIMQDKFKPRLDSDFNLQYEDPDFDGQLMALFHCMVRHGTARYGSVRHGTARLGLRFHCSLVPDDYSIASSDTDILPHVPLTQRQKNWPDFFPVPAFSYEVEHVFEEGNRVFESSGKTLKFTRSQKHNVLENIAQTMHSFKPYPNDREFGRAAEALVTLHPCLKELGSDSGWYGWTISLKFKLGNYRTKLARSGCAEVSINAGKRSNNNPESEHPHSSIKRARCSEVNFLHNFPKGEKQSSLEQKKLQIIQVEKTEKSALQLSQMLKISRYSILNISMFLCLQVCVEFHRITSVNLRNTFYSQLNRHTSRLINLYRQKASRTGKTAEALREILGTYDLQYMTCDLGSETPDNCIDYILQQEEEPDICDTTVALLTSGTDPFSAEKVFVVLEGNIVLKDLPRLAEAFVLLFGLIYAFNLEYPKKLVHTFTFIQKMLVCLDDSKPLKPSLLNLKNDLLK
uniref:Uncharacterized protein n=1 Tax=Sinocyclocheilus rhinocerous TaxID=307959 RepID=A0A673HB22_9TELE